MAKRTQHFPPTHYDYLKKHQADLYEAVIADVEAGFEGPTDSVDELPAFPAFADWYMNEFIVSLADKLAGVFGYKLQGAELMDVINQHVDLRMYAYSMSAAYQCLFNFVSQGKKTFYFAEPLVERMSVTEMDAPSEFLHLPYPACMFVLNDPVSQEAFKNIGETHSDVNAPITVYAYERPYLGCRKIVFAIYQTKGDTVHSFVKRELLIHPDWRIEQSLQTDWGKLQEQPEETLNEDSLADFLGLADDDSRFYHQGLPFFRILVNGILYLASNEPDVRDLASPIEEVEAELSKATSRGKRKKLKNEAAKSSALDGTAVGGRLERIHIHKHAGKSTGVSRAGSMIAKRFFVRGHWRNQAHGPKHSLRKLTYIPPYIKGPEASELINKPYVVR